MKSRFTNLFDYKKIPFEKEVVLFCSNDYLESAKEVRPDLSEDIIANAFFASQENSYLEEIANKILEQVITNSTWDLDDEEIESAYKLELAEIEDGLEEEDMTFNDCTEDDFYDMWGVETKEEALEVIKEQASFRIKFALFCSYNNGLDLAKANFDEPEYFNSDFLVNYIKKDLHFINEIEGKN